MIRRGWLLAGCLAAAFAAQAQPAPAAAPAAQAAPDPERQLQAIRDALVEKTLSAPVRVQSFGWIDTEGRLHESTQFTSDTRVRGVRVQAYVEDPTAPVRVQVDTSVLPAGVGREADPQRCQVPARRWRQALHVEAASPEERAGGHALVALSREMERAFLEAASGSRRWVAQRRPYQPATAYEQALVGREADRTEWLVRIALEPGDGLVQARIELAPLSQPAPRHQLRLVLPGVETGVGRTATLDPHALRAAMSGALATLERQSACEPLWYSVAAQGDRLHLREGAAHGLQPGDRLLLVERQHLPGRLLEPGAARGLALVQVEASAAHGTALRWLAGHRPAQAGDWVALPL